jgi:Caspase domain
MSEFNRGHAVIVGTGGDLPNTVDGAKAVASIVTSPGRCAYPSGQVSVSIGEQATRERVLAAFDLLATSTDPRSTAVVYFSGHGYRWPLHRGSPISSLLTAMT